MTQYHSITGILCKYNSPLIDPHNKALLISLLSQQQISSFISREICHFLIQFFYVSSNRNLNDHLLINFSILLRITLNPDVWYAVLVIKKVRRHIFLISEQFSLFFHKSLKSTHFHSKSILFV